MSQKSFFRTAMLVGLAVWMHSCQKTDQPSPMEIESKAPGQQNGNGWTSPEVVTNWSLEFQKAFTYALNVPASSPPLISRAFAMYHVAMHDALNCVKPKYATYAYHQRDKDAHPDAAVAQAAYDVALALGKVANDPVEVINRANFAALLSSTLQAIPDGDAKTRGIALGHKVASAIVALRDPDKPLILVKDAANQPPNGTQPGEYRYLPPLEYALPRFHLQQTWALSTASQFRSPVPYAISSAAYATDFEEVKKLGKLNSTDRSNEQTEIGVFWAENSSRGWNAVALDIIGQRPGRSMDAWKTARLLALLHAAVADAYIGVFEGKVYYNYWRPISAVRLADTDGNTETIGDPTWLPQLNTPAVAEYPSAHAMSGAAAGQVLIRFFGSSRLPFSINSGYLPTTVRSYDNMHNAIRDNSLSRIYIGYHFRKAIDEGQAAGYKVGDWIFDHILGEQ